MSHVISFEFLNFLNFGEGEKQLVGLRQASGRRQKSSIKTKVNLHLGGYILELLHNILQINFCNDNSDLHGPLCTVIAHCMHVLVKVVG